MAQRIYVTNNDPKPTRPGHDLALAFAQTWLAQGKPGIASEKEIEAFFENYDLAYGVTSRLWGTRHPAPDDQD